MGEESIRKPSITEVSLKKIPLTHTERPWLKRCPNCGFKCGRDRSGAEFAGEVYCNNCRHVWAGTYPNFYSGLP